MYYSFEDNPTVDLSCFKEGLSNFQYTQKDNADYYYSGTLNNLKCIYSERGIRVFGSLCKYNYGYNFNTLSKRETSNTIGRLTDQLGFDIYKAKCSRIDFSTNFNMIHNVTKYYPYLLLLSRFKRHIQPDSLYYNQAGKNLVFYDKIKEAKAKRVPIPNKYKGTNLLRYELRLKSQEIKKQFNRVILLEDLASDEVYNHLVKVWESYYNAIDKKQTIQLPMSTIKTPKDIKEHIYTLYCQQHPEDIMEVIESAVFDRNEYRSRARSEFRRNLKKAIGEESIIAELNEKVKNTALSVI